jgi:predicted nucleic acid-binding protein
MAKRTYLDSCVLIAAFQGERAISDLAMAIIDDPDRSFVVSQYLSLEVLPKPQFNKKKEEVAFMSEFLRAASESIESNQVLADQAILLAGTYDLSPIDALHVSAAKQAAVDEFITAESNSKPMFRVSDIKITSLRD